MMASRCIAEPTVSKWLEPNDDEAVRDMGDLFFTNALLFVGPLLRIPSLLSSSSHTSLVPESHCSLSLRQFPQGKTLLSHFFRLLGLGF